MTQQDPLYEKWIASGQRREPVPPGTRVEPSVPVLRKGGNALGVVALGIGSTAFFAGLAALSWKYAPTHVMLPVFFGLAAAGIFGYTIYDGLRRYKYGTTTLRLHNPVAVGRELSAELVLSKAPADLKEIRLALLCESTRWKLRRVCSIPSALPSSAARTTPGRSRLTPRWRAPTGRRTPGRLYRHPQPE